MQKLSRKYFEDSTCNFFSGSCSVRGVNKKRKEKVIQQLV
jgi:hypothetical protein